jgi:hypothetical protein
MNPVANAIVERAGAKVLDLKMDGRHRRDCLIGDKPLQERARLKP